MNWGGTFRQAWQDATPNAQAAAREVVRSVERAAGSMSDNLLHALQLAHFAAQDLERLHTAAAHPEVPLAFPEMGPVQKAMDEIRQGRVNPDKAERHLRQALQTVAREARIAPVATGTGVDAASGELMARQRLRDLRRAVLQQNAALRDQLMERACGDEAATRRLAHVAGLAQACSELDSLFLDTKRADDPAVPLPCASRDEGDD